MSNNNVTVEYHWLEGQSGGLPGLMADLVRRRVTVIFTANNVGSLAAKAATSDIPIVFVVGLDPVLMGLVSSINRPAGNATGISFQVSALEPKRFELLPGADHNDAVPPDRQRYWRAVDEFVSGPH